MFELHPQLENDTDYIFQLPLCRVRLMDNSLFPWIILVPAIENITELTDLTTNDQRQLMDEICRMSELMKKAFNPDKLNVATLGNQVPQLHIHIIARYKSDSAWPNPVWGNGRKAYMEMAK